jgi:hypothetical protein
MIGDVITLKVGDRVRLYHAHPYATIAFTVTNLHPVSTKKFKDAQGKVIENDDLKVGVRSRPIWRRLGDGSRVNASMVPTIIWADDIEFIIRNGVRLHVASTSDEHPGEPDHKYEVIASDDQDLPESLADQMITLKVGDRVKFKHQYIDSMVASRIVVQLDAGDQAKAIGPTLQYRAIRTVLDTSRRMYPMLDYSDDIYKIWRNGKWLDVRSRWNRQTRSSHGRHAFDVVEPKVVDHDLPESTLPDSSILRMWHPIGGSTEFRHKGFVGKVYYDARSSSGPFDQEGRSIKWVACWEIYREHRSVAMGSTLRTNHYCDYVQVGRDMMGKINEYMASNDQDLPESLFAEDLRWRQINNQLWKRHKHGITLSVEKCPNSRVWEWRVCRGEQLQHSGGEYSMRKAKICADEWLQAYQDEKARKQIERGNQDLPESLLNGLPESETITLQVGDRIRISDAPNTYTVIDLNPGSLERTRSWSPMLKSCAIGVKPPAYPVNAASTTYAGFDVSAVFRSGKWMSVRSLSHANGCHTYSIRQPEDQDLPESLLNPPDPAEIAEQAGVDYQGCEMGLYQFKELTTNGNFSIRIKDLSLQNVEAKRDQVKQSFMEAKTTKPDQDLPEVLLNRADDIL